ncbi:hypothetical protein Hdeb2414_s0026g00683611 [Helianthus debilis subsp. tardiflorus]
MGGCKLKVNIARFALENEGGSVQTDSGFPKSNSNVGRTGVKLRTSNFRDFRSYSDVLGKGKVGEAGREAGNFQVPFCQENLKSVVAPDRTAALCDLRGLAVVGRTVDLETLVDLDRLLSIAKVSCSNIQYLGGLSVMISFGEEASSKQFLEARHIWGPWFSKLSAWEGQSMPFEKVAWLRLIGFPLHLLDSEVVRSVGELFGKVLHVQSALREEKDLSICRVGILSGAVERINEAVSVKWKNRCYRIWVEEEVDVWVPDCLGGVKDFNPSGSSPLASSPVVKMAESGIDGGTCMVEEEVGMGNGSSRGDEQVDESAEIGDGGVATKEVMSPRIMGIGQKTFYFSRQGKSPKEGGRVGSIIVPDPLWIAQTCCWTPTTKAGPTKELGPIWK